MEVATAVLYLQAVLEELDTSDEQAVAAPSVLAERLDSVCSGADSEPLELWMEDFAAASAITQTMGSVVKRCALRWVSLSGQWISFFAAHDTHAAGAGAGRSWRRCAAYCRCWV